MFLVMTRKATVKKFIVCSHAYIRLGPFLQAIFRPYIFCFPSICMFKRNFTCHDTQTGI